MKFWQLFQRTWFYPSPQTVSPGLKWPKSSLSEQVISNLAHIPAYALLTFLWLKTFGRKENSGTLSMVNALILIGLVIFAISDEIHQSFVPGRTASFMDVGLDFLGIFCGLSTFKISRQFKLFQER